MKKIIFLLLMLMACICQAQTFPVQNLTVAGTSSFTGQATFTLSPTGPTPSPGDNTTKFATTAFVSNSLAGYALLASPVFIGSPSAPTQATGDNSTALATDAFVKNQGYSTSASPSFTGTPSAPTAPLGTNTTQIATTAFVVQHQICADILDYGGDNTNTSNNDTAFASAFASGSSTQKCVYLPAGKYKFASAITSNLPSGWGITIRGDGPTLTVLTWASGNGIQFNATSSNNSVHIRDLSLLTGTTAGGFAIGLIDNTNGSSPYPTEISDITNVSIHGSDGYAATNYWSQGVSVNSWSNINFVNVNIEGGGGGGPISGYTGQGVGINLTGNSGSGAPPIGIQYNIIGCQINYLLTGIQYSSNVQGVAVSQSNFVGGTFGISVPSSQTGTSQLTVIGSQFNEGTYAIQDNSGVPAVQIQGNYFLIPTPSTTSVGVFLNSSYGAEIVGNQFQRIGASASGTNGIVLGTTTGPGSIIAANVFINLGTAVWLNSSSSIDNVQSNRYAGNSTNVLNQGTGNTVGGGSQ